MTAVQQLVLCETSSNLFFTFVGLVIRLNVAVLFVSQLSSREKLKNRKIDSCFCAWVKSLQVG